MKIDYVRNALQKVESKAKLTNDDACFAWANYMQRYGLDENCSAFIKDHLPSKVIKETSINRLIFMNAEKRLKIDANDVTALFLIDALALYYGYEE